MGISPRTRPVPRASFASINFGVGFQFFFRHVPPQQARIERLPTTLHLKVHVELCLAGAAAGHLAVLIDQ